MTVQQWTGRMACALQSAADLTNERFADRLSIGTRTVAYWHSRPETIPGRDNQEALTAFHAALSAVVQRRFAVAVQETAVGSPGISDGVMTAVADSISTDPLLIDGDFASDSVEMLQEEMAILARAGDKAALDVFMTGRRLRDQARQLAERTRKPSVLADLYVVIGQATALMASTAFDLGHWNESAAMALASTKYATIAGHSSLEAWTYGLQMTLANWRNEPDAALMYLNRGMRVAPAGEPRFRLRYIAARSYALIGEAGAVADVLADAELDRIDADGRTDELSASVGGEFAFGHGRAAACAAAAWLDLGNGEEVVRYAEMALSSYEALPSFRQPYSQLSGAQIDIAAGRLHMNELDGAREALRGVLSLPPNKRNVSLTGRVGRVRDLLSLPPWTDDAEAHHLAEQTSTWLTETSAAPLS